MIFVDYFLIFNKLLRSGNGLYVEEGSRSALGGVLQSYAASSRYRVCSLSWQ